jgi:hypothetical protein
MAETQLFNAGQLVTSDYTGDFVIIRAKGSGVGYYNEDGSDYSQYSSIPGAVPATLGTNAATREEAIASAVAYLPNDVYYKVEDGGEGRFKTDIVIDYATVCPSKNREITESSGGSRMGGETTTTYWTKQICGGCISGYVEDPLDEKDIHGHGKGDCIAVAGQGNGDEIEQDTNWTMIVGSIAVLGVAGIFLIK